MRRHPRHRDCRRRAVGWVRRRWRNCSPGYAARRPLRARRARSWARFGWCPGTRPCSTCRTVRPTRPDSSPPATRGTGAHLLWRVKASTLLPRVGTFTDGSYLAVLPRPGTGGRLGIWVRVIEYTVTVTATTPDGASTTRVELFRLITTITDPQLATAAALADCYHQRWESETVYKSLKTHQRGPRQVLRSQDPDGVAQELYAYLITYQAVRRLMNQAAIAADIDPDRLSFTTALRAVRRFITSAATAAGHLLAGF